MKKRIISLLKVFLPLGLGVFLLWLLMRGYDIKDIYNKIAGANFKWAILSVLFGVIANINRSVRWNMLLKPLGYKPRLINTYFAVQVGYFYNLVFPRMGEVSRCTMLTSYENVPLDKSLGTVVTERVIDVLSLFVCLLIVLIFEFQLLSHFVMDKILHPFLSKFSFIAHGSAKFYLVAAAVLLVVAAGGYFAWRVLRRTSIYTKVVGIIRGFMQGLESVRRVENKGWFLFHTVSMWIFYSLGAYICFKCFDFTSSLSLFTGFVLMTFGAFGYVVPVQGGAGAYQAIVMQVLLLYGIPDDKGLAFGWLAWGGQQVGIILLGILSLILLPIINRSQLTTDEAPATDSK